MCEEIEFEIQEEDIPLTINLEDDVYLVEPKTENLEVTPTKETQYFDSETGIYYDNVTVNPIPDEYIIPNLGTKTITKNGTYNATDDNLDGYSQVEVTTSGVDINDYFETNYYGQRTDSWSGDKSNNWIRQYFIKKMPDLIIDNSITSLGSFSTNTVFIPKIICNSNIINMGSMYYGTSANNLDVSGLNTSNVTSMDNMFSSCPNLKSLDVSNFNTSKATNMNSMFKGCISLTSLDLSNFNTNNVTNMSAMFHNCTRLTSLNLSNFNTNNVINMASMFYNCGGLTSLDLSNFNTSKATNMASMFYNCSSLTSLDLSNFNATNVSNAGYMFQNCSSLTSLNLSNFDTSNLLNATFMFGGCRNLSNLDIRKFDFTNIGSYNNMFSNVPADCLIIVKDDTAKTWITSKFTSLKNVKTVAELEAA